MIAKIKGKVDSISKSALIVMVGDLGYRVFVPTSTLERLSKPGTPVQLFIHTYVREDKLDLYGFETERELSLFELLMTISGVGARIAISVISAGTPEEISNAVIGSDEAFFKNISGIGKRSARRIIVDLKSALGDESKIDFERGDRPSYTEAVEALKKFGFSVREARDAIRSIRNAEWMTSEELIKEALKTMGS